MGESRLDVNPGSTASYASGRLRRRFALPAFVAVVGTLLGAQLGIALSGVDGVQEAVGWDSTLAQSLYHGVVAIAAGALLLRAARVPGERLAWMLIGAGLVAWIASDVAATAGADGLASDLFRATFYGAELAGLLLLSRREPVEAAAKLDGAIILLGLVTIWSWLVLDQAIDRARSGETELVTALAYPTFNLALGLVLVAVFLRHGWPRSGSWLLIGFAFALTVIADTIAAVEAGAGGSGGADAVLNAAWASGAMLLGIAALTAPEPGAAPGDRVGRELSFGLAVVFITLAALILVAGRFEPVAIPTIALAALTLSLGLARTVSVHTRRASAEQKLGSPDLREVQALARAVDAKDPHTRERSDRVALYSAAIAVRLGLDVSRVARVILAAKLHDVGKIQVPDEILLKRGPLSPTEMEAVRRHPVEGERIVAGAGFPDAARWIRHHHERWDGSGYPDGLSAGEIPLESRILATADALEAMTAIRPYREAMSVETASVELHGCAGSQFDPGVVRVLVHLLRRGALRIEEGGAVPVASYTPDDASNGHLGLAEYLRVEALLAGGAAVHVQAGSPATSSKRGVRHPTPADGQTSTTTGRIIGRRRRRS